MATPAVALMRCIMNSDRVEEHMKVRRPVDATGRPPFGGVVAIDGPSGTGKSSVSRRLEAHLGARFLDTGSMYRAITYAALQRTASGTPTAETVAQVLHDVHLEIGTDPMAPSTSIDGVPANTEIRSAAVDAAVSEGSAGPGVRRAVNALQRGIIG